MVRNVCLSAVSVLALVLGACSKEEPAQPKVPKSALAENYWIAVEPAGAKSVAEVVKDAKNGDEVAVIGKVGGESQVFVADRALFKLVDLSLKDCSDDGMGCPTPWDYCCADPDAMKAGTLAVEFRDGGGKVLATTAQGYHGLDHGKTAIVKGRVLKDDAGNVVVVAAGLYAR